MNDHQLIELTRILNGFLDNRTKVQYQNKSELVFIEALYLRIGYDVPALLQVRLDNGLIH